MRDPCINCKPPKRRGGCHAVCPEGLAWDKIKQKKKDKYKAATDGERAADGHLSDTAAKIRRGIWR
ncbi:hypothetical protein LI177_05365 [bacterium 210820-DFI.6.37]|nr:hypothetical protein [bacterium 210820-DFI.6.37]